MLPQSKSGELGEGDEVAGGVFYADFFGAVEGGALGEIDFGAFDGGLDGFEIFNFEIEEGKKGGVMEAQRRLGDLISVGPAMLRDFERLGIRSVKELAKQEPKKMYAKLEKLTRQHQDICVLDAFEAAVAQARNPRLPAEKCEWWWWSRKRKAVEATR